MSKTKKEPDIAAPGWAWVVRWSEFDDGWISDGGTTVYYSKKEMEAALKAEQKDNTEKFNRIPITITYSKT